MLHHLFVEVSDKLRVSGSVRLKNFPDLLLELSVNAERVAVHARAHKR